MGKKKGDLGRALQKSQANRIKKMRNVRAHNAKTDNWVAKFITPLYLLGFEEPHARGSRSRW